jgi:ATP:ADP antiporter, AAA family
MTSILRQYFNIRPSELGAILMAALYFFFILTTLMILRPARDALGMQAGIDAIRWLFMGTLVATLLVNPLFGWLVSRFRRLTFITVTYAFFALNLLIFAGLLLFAEDAVGITSGNIFYVWMSVFNLFLTMIFWALMADRFSLEQSKRLFGVIAVGGTVGAIFGSAIAWQLAEVVGAPMLLVIAACFLGLAIAAAWGVALLQPERRDLDADDPEAPPVVAESAIIGGKALEGFRAVFKSPYLMGISAYVLILAVVVTFIYFTRLQMVAALGDSVDMRAGVFAQLDLATQIATLLLQLVVAGHVMKRLGVHVALVLAPVTAALGFIGLAMVASLVVLVIFDAVFKAIQRAIMRPARETLFTVVSREEKYKAKAFIDTFVYRGGDALGAQTEGWLGRLGMGLYALTLVVVPMAIAWAALGLWLGRQQSKLAENNHHSDSAVEADAKLALNE